MMTNYDSGNIYLNKLHELIEDLKVNEDNYSTWEIDFICNLEEQMFQFEVGDRKLSDSQENRIDELYMQHGLED